MKKVKMVQILFILLCLLGYGLTTAQTDYLVTAKGDTIRGTVKYLNFGSEKKVQVTNADKKKTVYSILQVKSFQLDNDQYQNIHDGQEYTFMKVEKSGYLSLYTFQLPNQTTWNGSYLRKKDGEGMEIPTLTFKKTLRRYLADCHDVVARIESGELTRSKLNEIIDRYNACIDSKSKVIQQAPVVNPATWENLEKEVGKLNDFPEKSTALDMIYEIKTKVKNGEKVPNFLKEGIKEVLKDQSTVQPSLEKALQEIQ